MGWDAALVERRSGAMVLIEPRPVRQKPALPSPRKRRHHIVNMPIVQAH